MGLLGRHVLHFDLEGLVVYGAEEFLGGRVLKAQGQVLVILEVMFWCVGQTTDHRRLFLSKRRQYFVLKVDHLCFVGLPQA